MPTSAPKLAIAAVLALLLTSSLYLLATRGPAMLVDLAAAAWACF